MITPALLFLFRIVLAVWGILCFHMSFGVKFFSYFCDEFYWDFNGSCIEFVGCLILPIREHRRSSIL
jgi:hypothetical protein